MRPKKQVTPKPTDVGSSDLLECASMLERQADKCDRNAAAKLRRWAKWIAYHAASNSQSQPGGLGAKIMSKPKQQPPSPLAGAPGSGETFAALRIAVQVARGRGNPELADWRDIEWLLAAYDGLNDQLTEYERDNASICYECGCAIPPNKKLSGGGRLGNETEAESSRPLE